MTDRVVVLVDMDCFYCQVESRLNPTLSGKPMAVVQYNEWKGGGIIAVNYEARDKGVTRSMRGADAQKLCPEIILVRVPTVRDKADLTRYRDAGREVLTVFCRFTNQVQRASIDEAYIDLTSLVDDRMKTLIDFDASKWKSTFVVGYTADGFNDEGERQRGMKSWLEDCESIGNTSSLRLAVGALIVEEIRAAVLAETGFKCSAGIAHNKVLAKLACGLHKPNRQTIVPQEGVEGLYKTLPIRKIRNLGGKFGEEIVEKLGCKTMSDLAKYSERELQNVYDDKTGTWLYNIARGLDFETVTARLISKSIGCCKRFPGRQALIKSKDVYHFLNKLSEELSERLLEDETMNKRRAHLLTLSTSLEINRVDQPCSKSIALASYAVDKIVNQAESLLKKICKVDSSGSWSPPIKFLGLSAGKFSEISSNKIDTFFKCTTNLNSKPSSNLFKPEENEIKGNCDNSNDKEEKLSFFERMFAKEIHNSGKKLHLIPDLTKNDLFLDSDDSQSSMKKLKQESSELSTDNIKKQLFNSSLPEKKFTLEKKVSVEKSSFIAKKENISNDNAKNAKRKINESSNKTIASFFTNASITGSSCWTKPEELFPDINQVDEELISLLPESYRNYIIKRKKEKISEEPKHEIGPQKRSCSPVRNESIYSSGNSKNNTEANSITDSLKNIENELPPNKPLISVDKNVQNALLVECGECGEKILDYEVHMDMHLAKKLHKELNSYSTVLTKNINYNNKEKKKRKSKTNSTVNSTKKIKSIDSFFTKR